MTRIRVYICDDHQLMLDGLSLILQNDDQITKVGEGKNGRELLNWLKTNDADVVLMDINMPVLDGIRTCEKISNTFPEVKVIFLSMIDQKEILPTLKNLNAKGFLLKNSSREEVLKVIKLVAGGGTYFEHKSLDSPINPIKKVPNKYIPKLTNREMDVLKLIIEEYTSPDIAEKLYISVGTVDTHRRNLISKLGVKNTAGLVRVAIEYRLIGN